MSPAAVLNLLPVEQRLALAYTPRGAQGAALAVLALDSRLAGLVRSAAEPVLGQIKLAWWRDRLGSGEPLARTGEPVLALIGTAALDRAALVGLVDGWELLIGEGAHGPAAVAGLVEARIAAIAAATADLGAACRQGELIHAAGGWAWADLAARLTQPQDRAVTQNAAAQYAWRPVHLPRAARWLAILYGLGRRYHDGGPLLGGKRAFVAAVRLGIVGR